jgi:hypothetical protein
MMMLQRAALLLATLAIHSANALSPGAEVTVGAVRVQALSDTLIRVECAAANTLLPSAPPAFLPAHRYACARAQAEGSDGL